MLVFLSHASKNKDIALRLVSLLEDCGDVNVFCSSDDGAIPIGKNFVNYIYGKIDESDVFVPLLTEDYFKSKFCMIELGAAISYIYQKKDMSAGEYIFPFCVDPITPDEALRNTPISQMQAADVFDKNQIYEFIKAITRPRSGSRARIDDFVHDMTSIIIENKALIDRTNNIFSCAFGAGVVKDWKDFFNCIAGSKQISTAFNLNPYNLKDPVKPDFVSTVLMYVDGVDLHRYFKVYPNACFRFTLNNFTNSLKRIFVELKYGDNNNILGRPAEIAIHEGVGDYSFSLDDYRYEALKKVTQICFVIHPGDVVEDEGSFIIENIRVQ